MVSTQRLYIGVDLGGTNVRSGLVDSDGNILSQDTRKSLPRVSAEAPVKQIVDSMTAVIKAGGCIFSDISGIGIGSPGPLDGSRGVILRAGNLPHWINFPLTDIISERTGVRSYLQNDASLFAFGEWWKGAGRGFTEFCAMTLGTGIGGGAICGGRLLTGFNDNACEVGHTTIDYNGPQCWCGQRGCIELYSSATGLARMTREALVNEHIRSSLEEYRTKPGDLDAKIIADAAALGDEFAISMLDRAGYLLGICIVNTLNVLNFERIAIGGGLSEAGELILEPARRALNDRGFASFNSQVSVVPAELPGTAGILGAVRLVIERETAD
jgi:glucokinase